MNDCKKDEMKERNGRKKGLLKSKIMHNLLACLLACLLNCLLACLLAFLLASSVEVLKLGRSEAVINKAEKMAQQIKSGISMSQKIMSEHYLT